MISIFKGRINVNHDSLQEAIQKKINNDTLSNKSINKIIKIANIQHGFKSGEAESIFSNNGKIKTTSPESLKKLINTLKDVRTNTASDFMSDKLKTWENKARQALTPIQKEYLAKGSRGVVYKDGCDFVIKETTMSNGMIAHDANMCNEYNLKSGGTGNIATVTGNHIRMPFLSGKEPSEENVIDGVKALYDKGFMIADACPSNFLRCQSGEIVPIDFGLVFKRDELDSIDSQVKIEIVRDYIKGGCEYIPSELKTEYISCISKLYQCLGDQSSSIDVNVRELRKAGLLSPMKFNK